MFLPIKQKPCSQKGYKVLRKHVMKKVDGYNLATFWPLKRREPAPRTGSYYGGEGSMDMSDSTGSRCQLDDDNRSGTCPCRARSALLPFARSEPLSEIGHPIDSTSLFDSCTKRRVPTWRSGPFSLYGGKPWGSKSTIHPRKMLSGSAVMT